MKSSVSKVLHKVCQTSMIEIVIDKAILCCNNGNNHLAIVCSDENIEAITKICNAKSKNATFSTYIQKQRLGTGHAVKTALDDLPDDFDKICVLYGDSPLFEPQTIANILQCKNSITFAGFIENNPLLQYGRFITEGQKLLEIVEFKDASPTQKQITFFNSGLVGGGFVDFKNLVNKIQNNNSQSEFYLTDIAKLSGGCGFVECDKVESLGVNTMQDLGVVEQIMQNNLRQHFMTNGVHLIEPSSVFFSLQTSIEPDVTIEPSVVFRGKVQISSGCVIKSFSYIEDSTIGANCSIGPFARFRGGSKLGEACKIGNFVEVKASHLASGVKAGHLAYIGDGQIGQNTNIGAGAVFCNYDGTNKHKTIVGDNVFIGSNTSLVAPITIGDDAIIAAGSVATKTINPEELYISRPIPNHIQQGATRLKNKTKKT